VRPSISKAIPTAGFPPPPGHELDAKMEGTTNEVLMCIAQAPVQRNQTAPYNPGLKKV
jgi:hypothetical protein